jgi:surfeit locus 1 family protein
MGGSADPATEAAERLPRRATLWVLSLLAGALVAGLLALGGWQVQRLLWKQDLLARVARHQAAAPVAVPPASAWPALNRADDEYRRVSVRGRYAHGLETLVQASTALGSGYWVLTPLRSSADGSWWLVNRGFVPAEQRDPARRGSPATDDEQTVQGLLRLSEPGGSLLQANQPAAGRWYARDVAAIAAARGLGQGAFAGLVAPLFIDATADPVGAEVWPRPGLTVLNFSNNHLAYALTWFALAALLAAASTFVLRREWRLLRRAAGEVVRAPVPD